jgi:hypothetical protein
MYYLSFDIANKSLAISLIKFDKEYKQILNKTKIKSDNYKNTLMNMTKLNKELNHIFDYYIYEVVDLIPQQKVRETTLIDRSKKLKEFLNKLNIQIIDIKNKNNIENITVLVEYQPSFNEKSRTIYNQIIYEYSNIPNYKLYIMNPLYKNKLYFSSNLKHSYFIQKYNNNYIANKNHTKVNFLYFLDQYKLNHIIKKIKKKNIDDLADSFMQILAYIYFIESQ